MKKTKSKYESEIENCAEKRQTSSIHECGKKKFRRRKRSPASSFTRGQITLAKLRKVGATVTGCRNIIIQFKLISFMVKNTRHSIDQYLFCARHSTSSQWCHHLTEVSPSSVFLIQPGFDIINRTNSIIIIDYTIDHCHHNFRQLSSCRQHFGDIHHHHHNHHYL